MDPDLLTKLKQQLRAYIVQCRPAYKELVHQNEIVMTAEHQDATDSSIQSDMEMHVVAFCDSELEITNSDADILTPETLSQRCVEYAHRRESGNPQYFYRKIRDYLQVKYNLRVVKPHGQPRVFRRLKLKSPTPRQL